MVRARGAPRVIIVGAGFAGLSAAKTLTAQSDAEVVLLEASPFVGGRARTGTVSCCPPSCCYRPGLATSRACFRDARPLAHGPRGAGGSSRTALCAAGFASRPAARQRTSRVLGCRRATGTADGEAAPSGQQLNN